MIILKHEQEGFSTEAPFTISVPAFRKGRILFLISGILVLAAFFILLPSMMVRYSHIEVSRMSGFLLFSARISSHIFYPFAGTSLLLAGLLMLNLWAFFAKEKLVILEREVLFSKTLFGIGHTHHLDPDSISKVVYIPSTMSITPTKRDQTFKVRSFHEGKIALTCSGRIFSFGRSIEDQQAARLADEIDLLIRSRQTNASQIQLTPAK